MTVPQRVLDTMNSGLIYTCDDEEMIKAQQEQMELLYDFNCCAWDFSSSSRRWIPREKTT